MRNPLAQERATFLRKNLTDAERALWKHLRRRQMNGHRFRRQVPVGPYIADFACIEIMLIIEVDGSQHKGSKVDNRRDRYLGERGFRVLRFWDNDVLKETETVKAAIFEAVTRPLPNLPP